MDDCANENVIDDSLREIATLILLLHENYIKDSSGKNQILVSLVRFLTNGDICDKVSIIDAEILRRKVMYPDDTFMEYDKFYNWLRDVAKFIYEDSDNNSLHSLLMDYIIPLASKGTHENPIKYFLNNASVDVMIIFFDFLRNRIFK
jgi:hypothetical protein